MIRFALILAVFWSALAVQPGLSEVLKVAGVAFVAAALASRPSILMALVRQPPLVVVALVAVLSSLTALEPAAWLGSAARAQGALIALALLVLAAAAMRLPADQRRPLVGAVAWLGGVIAVHVLLQRLRMDPLSWQGLVDQRPAATLSNPTTLAGWLLLVLPPTLGLVFTAARRRQVWFALAALQFAALLASGTRSAILALLLVAALAWVGCGGRSRRAWLALVTAAVVAFLAVVALAAWRPASLQDRAHLWRSAAAALVTPPALVDLHGHGDDRAWLRPWFGYGCDGQQPVLTAASARSDGARAEASGWIADRAHQGVLDRALEQGIAGVLAALLLVVAVARALWTAWHSGDRGQHIETLALAVALGAWSLHLQASFGLTGDRTLAWVWIGMALALGERARASKEPADPVARRVAAPGWRPWLIQSIAIGLGAALLLGAMAAGGALSASLSARVAPALQAELEFAAGQAAYAKSMAASGIDASGNMAAAAAAFERAAELRRHDRDAGLAAASARIELAALTGSAADLERARKWIDAARRLAPADRRLVAVDARIAAVAARLGR